MGRALYTPMFVAPTQPVNTVGFIFLDARAPGFFADWEQVARDLAAEALPLSGDIGQTLVVYSAEPGSPADDSLDAGT